ncbi:MAG: hypothetical protein KME43_06265 [Myxacorys chilensis ATA2-1-KO14]|jgi:hypothetical protein|nr:hypothetical protein [Myxacorys chilensis ATA2-1-KO14]
MKRVLLAWLGVLVGTSPALGDEPTSIDLDPQIIQNSPVLQRWLKEVPTVADDIQNDPSFRTRARIGYLRFSPEDDPGLALGIEDLRVGKTRLTLSGDYQTTFKGRSAIGANLNYYLRPLGSYVNVAPVVGYRHLETDRYSTSGATLGVRVLLVLSRGGGADIALSQSWVAPGSDSEVGLSTLSFGYAVTHHLRISTDLQRQNSRQERDDRIGIGLEWMP